MPRTGRPRTVHLPMNEIRQLAKRGWCLRLIANRYGCSRQCVCERMQEAGISRLPQWSQPGPRNGQWRGGIQIDDDGYVLVWMPTHPFANNAGTVRQHRLVMELKLGRYLTRKEVVHHKDGNKKNNRIDNLELFASNGDHLKKTLKGKCPKWTKEGRRRILEAIRRPKKSELST